MHNIQKFNLIFLNSFLLTIWITFCGFGQTTTNYHDYVTLTGNLKKLTEQNPNLLKMVSLGQSRFKKDIWMVTLSDTKTGKPDKKPALLIVANLEGNQLIGSEIVLGVIESILNQEKINNSVFGLYEHYRENQNLQFILICGQRFYPELKERLNNCFKPSDKLVFSLFPFVKDIEGIYRIADLVISRAGATTVAELATTGIPSILVPYPEAIEDHQFYNASQLVEAKKSIIILDKYLNKDILINNIESLLANKREKYVNMKKAASRGIKMESQALIVEKMFALI